MQTHGRTALQSMRRTLGVLRAVQEPEGTPVNVGAHVSTGRTQVSPRWNDAGLAAGAAIVGLTVWPLLTGVQDGALGTLELGLLGPYGFSELGACLVVLILALPLAWRRTAPASAFLVSCLLLRLLPSELDGTTPALQFTLLVWGVVLLLTTLAFAVGAYGRTRRAVLLAVLALGVENTLNLLETSTDSLVDRAADRELLDRLHRDAVACMQALETLTATLSGTPVPAGRQEPEDLAGLDLVAGRFRDAGLPAQVRSQGDLGMLPSDLDGAALRIVQEALTNALKHSGLATTWVEVDLDREWLRLRITNGPPQPGVTSGAALGGRTRPAFLVGDTPLSGGHGLLGMRERAAAFGGHVTTGPTTDGGWQVHAELPLDREPMTGRPTGASSS